MAQVLLLSATPAGENDEENLAPLQALCTSASRDRFGVHVLTDNPEAADVILFVEAYGAGWHFELARRHPFTRRYREKCFLFSSITYAIPFLPGIYTSVGKRDASRRTVPGFYIGMPENEFATCTPAGEHLRYLFSFVGSMENAAVRRAIAHSLGKHPRGLVWDTAADFARVLRREMPPEERREYHRRYAEVTRRSKFVLCPRGLSVSSMRLFETMKMGRVPVILADDWLPPPGPPWEEFSIRVHENGCAELPRILEEREAEAVQMGERARQVWCDWFSEEAAFHRVVEWCLAIRERRRVPESLARWGAYRHLLQPFHFRRAVRRMLGAARQTLTRSSSMAPARARQQRTAPR
jgi:hypothetical protein